MTDAPPRLFDSHAHFFTADTARYPINVSGAREGEETIRARIAAEAMDDERLIALWDRHGVTGGAAVQYNTIYKTDNRYALDVADAWPERAAAVLILNAADPDTPALLRGLALAHNVVGLRLFGYPDAQGEYPWLDSPAALRTWDVAAELGLAMVVMYAPGEPSAAALQRIAALAERYHPMPIAVDHCGWAGSDGARPFVGPAHRVLARIETVSLKFTQINLNRLAARGADASAFVAEIVEMFGPERLMWGSDVGNTTVPYGDMVAQAVAATARLDEAARRKVLHDNGRRLFGGGRRA